jgi:serine/threonine-protein kinase HipA
MSSRQIYVSMMLGEETYSVGRLWFHQRKGRESTSFEYDENWLAHEERFALEPALRLMEGQFHTQAGQSLFGAIGDSAPDRWGRVLMRRAESQRVKAANAPAHTLNELDFLLGVNDEARQGALRFSEQPEGPYLAQKDSNNIPPLIELPRLLSATQRFLEDEESAEDLKLLLAPGSSLGGARPKASVRDQDGQLSIAKFPRKDDEHNVVIWEAVALTLAQQAGIDVPEWRLERITDKPVLMIRRFDRVQGERIPFLSAMSMLGARDNEQHSYLEIGYALAQYGAQPERDMEQLWRRIVFTVLISNTDDHLRNHGFIYKRHKGWRLSPAYDMNPTPVEIKPRILSTAIDLDDSTASLDTALSVAKEFRLDKARAHEIVEEVAASVKGWRDAAKRLGLNTREIDFMASAFEHEDLKEAGGG